MVPTPAKRTHLAGLLADVLAPPPLGALYVDNHALSPPFRPESLRAAEALARHAAMAIEHLAPDAGGARVAEVLARDGCVVVDRLAVSSPMPLAGSATSFAA